MLNRTHNFANSALANSAKTATGVRVADGFRSNDVIASITETALLLITGVLVLVLLAIGKEPSGCWRTAVRS